jgi:basic membrane protein A and related proteins
MRARRWTHRAALCAAAAALALTVAACGDDDSGSDTAGAGSTAASGEGFRVGLVSDVGKFNDRSFNQSALEGLERAQAELGVQGRPIESRAAGDYVPNLTTLARQNYGLTIGNGYLMAEGINAVATRFPDRKFAIIDYSQTDLKDKPANVRGVVFASNENSYMIGYMAAKMAQAKGGRQVISAVGGQKLPTVEIFIAGYKAGAEAANPDVKVLIGYSQDFVAQAKCKELALDQIQQGSQAVFQVAGQCGLGALDAARERDVWGIGVDRDQSDLGDHILTSAVKRVDVSVYDSIQDAIEGNLTGGDKLYNLENEGVGLGKISDEVPPELVAEVEALEPRIISGEIEVPTKVQ